MTSEDTHIHTCTHVHTHVNTPSLFQRVRAWPYARPARWIRAQKEDKIKLPNRKQG